MYYKLLPFILGNLSKICFRTDLPVFIRISNCISLSGEITRIYRGEYSKILFMFGDCVVSKHPIYDDNREVEIITVGEIGGVC